MNNDLNKLYICSIIEGKLFIIDKTNNTLTREKIDDTNYNDDLDTDSIFELSRKDMIPLVRTMLKNNPEIFNITTRWYGDNQEYVVIEYSFHNKHLNNEVMENCIELDYIDDNHTKLCIMF